MSNSTSSGMDSMSMGGGCKISMLWNWNTVDACFISDQWHVKTVGAYAGSVIGVFFLVQLIEWVRRASREYDRYLVKQHTVRAAAQTAMESSSDVKVLSGSSATTTVPIRPTLIQQLIRSFLYFLQFCGGYMIMLLAMYYNGGILFAIGTGAFFGHFASTWDTLGHVEMVQKDCCC
ncbi:Ctr copper transporter [Cylindrobasidium torrendii FP15055 ss-10]|uniref:Copper transport protein n=1 Tax=Cylindrobasidium torrendii FP15055 ss-10 TaxID=1314674 RepID=A0A0D7BK38_9AGAR|nr:Ctr copper transporter [Cylindrobasidium torrendii FP15055 ss-10]